MFALLIDRGAEVNAVANNGESVLKAAQRRADLSPRILALLQEKGAQLTPHKRNVATAGEADAQSGETFEIHPVGTGDLDLAVSAASQKNLVIAVFCAEWAQPYCSKYRTTVEKLPRVTGARLVWVTAGENDAAALAPYRVMGFPHTTVIWQGKVLGDQVGDLKPEQFDKLIQSARSRIRE